MKSLSEGIHVVAFDIPYPANYGGVIDIYYRLLALHDLGIPVTLHCYEYGRSQSSELEQICRKVYYYKRKTFKNPLYSKLPYIVNSRNSTELLDNLKGDKRPILFEGLHCCYYLSHPDLKQRFKIVRTHNVEHDYYRNLEEVETNFFKKYFFRVESERLKRFESNLKHAQLIAAISPSDYTHFKKKFDGVIYLPAFHPNVELRSSNGSGDFAFYHGNLSVGENDEAARFLVTKVFDKLEFPLIIAGNKPSKELRRAVNGHRHIQVLDGLSSAEMLSYISNAHINVLPTFQGTGIKLKLINSLYLGRHCLANSTMVNNTGLEKFCTVANTPGQFAKKLRELWKKPFNPVELSARRRYLEENFNNLVNARKLIGYISAGLK